MLITLNVVVLAVLAFLFLLVGYSRGKYDGIKQGMDIKPRRKRVVKKVKS